MKICFTFEMWFSKRKFVLQNRQLSLAANRYKQWVEEIFNDKIVMQNKHF
jgi:hypothetical protein